jgi:hypothetical protein
MSWKQAGAGFGLALLAGLACAKLPPPPPADPAKAEEAKQKAAEAAKKDAELLVKYMDKAAMNYAAKAKSENKEFKPQLGPGIPPPPAPAAGAPAAAPAAAAAPPAKK